MPRKPLVVATVASVVKLRMLVASTVKASMLRPPRRAWKGPLCKDTAIE